MSLAALIDERIFSRLQKQINSQQWASTYLFTGDETEKKRALAIAFAKAVNCQERPFRTDCDCLSCERINKGTHPDVKWYGLDEEASSIKIQEARDFKNWLALKPYEAKVKFFIFQGADRLTPEAQNALLKSLEEPPPGNIIILLVDHARSLFDTIVSRAIEIKVPPFSAGSVRDILLAEGIDQKEAAFLGRISGGNLALARQIHEEGWYEERTKWIQALSKDPTAFLESFHGVKRRELGRVIDFIVEWVRDLLIYQATGDLNSVIYSESVSVMKPIVQKCGFDSLVELFQGMTQIRKSIDENANQKLAVTQAEIILERVLKS